MHNKLKILVASEASFIKSGFGIYNKELLSRLHASGKYEIAEFASYGFVNDPRDKDIHWRYYANAVKDNDPRHEAYASRGDNQFGRWRFDKVLLDFKPDVVIDIRDYWMSSYQALSPFRKYFHWILMPTVDSAPQQEEWIDTFLSANAIFTYSDWGAEVLKTQSSSKINYIDTVSPGVDLEAFRIKDMNKIKSEYGLPTESIIIGSVMRNQKRKLFPELFVSFRNLLNKLESTNPEMGKNVFLYLHTSYPDAGWDIPELLKVNRLLNKVYFTYTCSTCGHVNPGTFSHPAKVCPSCGNHTSSLPSVTNGVTSEVLSDIYNMFDLYVQYAICEGFGMPQVEAGACGVPIATVNYSAMCDIINKLNAYSIPVKSYFKELETKAIRVYPDNDVLTNIMYNHIITPAPIKHQKRLEVRKLTETHYNWTNIIDKWMIYLDRLDQSGYRSDWSRPVKFLMPPNIDKAVEPKNRLLDVARICAENIQDLGFLSSMTILSMLNDSDYTFTQQGMSFQPYDYKIMTDNLKKIIDNYNQAEYARANNMPFDEDYIKYAQMKAKSI